MRVVNREKNSVTLAPKYNANNENNNINDHKTSEPFLSTAFVLHFIKEAVIEASLLNFIDK